ncbi:MAG: hypothetical protein AB7W37_15680 [Syntrophobacteraceae bacterium]
MQAHPLPGIPEILDLLNHSANTTVAIVSGRPVQEVSLLLGEIGLTYGWLPRIRYSRSGRESHGEEPEPGPAECHGYGRRGGCAAGCGGKNSRY